MDRQQFTTDSPGRLVPVHIPARGNDLAFIPDDLPPRWKFSSELWPLLAAAKEALGTLNGIGQTLADPQLLLRPFQNREAITSSRIEGTYVTPEQLLLYELEPQEAQAPGDRVADWNEVYNYNRALMRGCELLETLPFCNRLIREMHSILMGSVHGRDKRPGEFRNCQVQIGSSGRFIPPPPEEVHRLMASLERYLNREDANYDPLVRCYLIHYQFEAIHPFADGNGRVGRALLALMIYKWLGHTMPWLYMSAFYEQFREEYMHGLCNISTNGDWTNWVRFCLRGTVAQATDAIDRCRRFHALKADFHGRIDTPSARSHALIESLFRTPVVTIPSVSKQFGVAYHTSQADIERLASVGILQEFEGQYPRTFFASEILRIAYGGPESVRQAEGSET